jgi:hypothetical protein
LPTTFAPGSSRIRARARRAVPALLLSVGLLSLAVACGGSPQVLEISPQRGAVDVPSSQAVRVRFDRPMDPATVAARFHVSPSVAGSIRWTGGHELSFEHAPFAPSTRYQVVIDPGYRDARGVTNSLRHSWTFQTESPPGLGGSSPGDGDRDVDPATYVALSFDREMDAGSLAGAISLAPGVPFSIRKDAADPRRVVLAPQSLLQPRQTYTVAVTQDARDVDGNHLAAGQLVTFTTGDFRPLRHWVSFVAESSPGTGDGGLWIVNENRFPRQLVAAPVTAFSWAPDGSRLLLRGQAGGWTDQALDGPATPLPIQADWAAYLTGGGGYASLDGGTLRVLRPDGEAVTVASGVTAAAVAPGGDRLAFATGDPDSPERGSQIDGYDTSLRTRFRLGAEPARVDGLSWSADGQSLAYRVDSGDPLKRQVRVRSLRDGGVVTVATGPVSTPAWQADRRHVFVTALVDGPGGPVARAFRFAIDDASPKTLGAAQALPGSQDVSVDTLSPSPDGHQLAFVGGGSGQPGVVLMNADGTGVARLTDYDAARFPYSCRAVAWTPS